MARQNDNVTLKITRQSISFGSSYGLGGGGHNDSSGSKNWPPMYVEATLQLYSKKKEMRFVGITVTKNHIFTMKTPELLVENVLDLWRLSSQDSPFIVEGSLMGAVYIKVQQVGDHLLKEDGMPRSLPIMEEK